MEEMDGVRRLGEIPVIKRRSSLSEFDHRQAYRSGATAAYNAVAGWTSQKLATLGRYEDTGLLAELQAFLTDRIREVNDDTGAPGNG